MTLNRESPIPLYYQLAERIREQIQTGNLQPGSQLDSEREFSEKLGISRMTVRQALGSLTQQGILETKKGLGTFVAEPKLDQEMFHLLGFTEAMMQKGEEKTASQVLEKRRVVPPPGVAKRLRLKAGEEAIKLVRLRFYNDVPLLLEMIFVPAEICPGLETRELVSSSLYTILEQDYGLHPVYAEQTLESTGANEYESELFNINPGMAMILLEGVTYLDTGEPVEHFKAVYRSDRFKFRLDSKRDIVPDDGTAPQILMLLG
jgi:GntR family transcriptional regulator